MTAPVRPDSGPKILTGDEWEAASYAPHRAGGDDPRKPMPAGRILTGDEWEQAHRAPTLNSLSLPALPKIAADATQRLNPNAQIDKGTPLPAFDIRDPSTYAAPLLRQVVNPALEHPFTTAAMFAAPAIGPAAASAAGALGAGAATVATVGTAANIGTVGALVAPMVKNIAQYGWQVAHESQMTDEERAVAQADPHRVSGESAAMQAIMLGLGPLIHVGAKAVSSTLDVGGGMMEAGAAGVKSTPLGPNFRPGFTDEVRTAELRKMVTDHAEGVRLNAAAKAELDRQNAAIRAAEEARKASLTAEELRQEEQTRLAAIRALTGVRRRPGGVPLTPEEARAADAAKLLGEPASPPSSGRAPLYFETPKGAEVLGTAAAAKGLPETASPYPPNTPQDMAWKAGHGGAYPEGFSMGGALTENRIPSDYTPPKVPRGTAGPTTGQTDLLPEGAPGYKGPVALYKRLSDEALGAEYRALLEKHDQLAPSAVAPIWDAEREARAVEQIENRRRPDGTLAPEDKRRLAALQAAQGEEYGVGRHTFESAAAERQLSNVTRHLTAIEAEIAGRGLKIEDIAKPPAAAGEGALPVIEGTGDVRTRGLAQSVEQRAVTRELTDYLGDLPEYRQLNMADQAAQAVQLLTDDPEFARRVALGEEPPPRGLLPESVFKAVERRALDEGDVATLRDLASGGLTAQATEMGRRIRALRDRDPESPVAAIQSISDLRGGGANANKAVADAVAELKGHLETAVTIDKGTLQAFIDSLRC